MTHRIVDSPVGPLALVVDAEGRLAGLYTDARRHPPSEELLGERDETAAPDVVDQLREYFAGERTSFDLPLAPRGTPFQRRVWDELRAIPAGQTRTYGQVALSMSAPRATRAVGAACGRNPISIVVPCHRVISSTGVLTGYAGGLPRKRWLLDHEAGRHPLPLGEGA